MSLKLCPSKALIYCSYQKFIPLYRLIRSLQRICLDFLSFAYSSFWPQDQIYYSLVCFSISEGSDLQSLGHYQTRLCSSDHGLALATLLAHGLQCWRLSISDCQVHLTDWKPVISPFAPHQHRQQPNLPQASSPQSAAVYLAPNSTQHYRVSVTKPMASEPQPRH